MVQYKAARMRQADYAKLVRARATIELLLGRRLNSLSEAVGKCADFVIQVSAASEEIKQFLQPEVASDIIQKTSLKKILHQWESQT